jgi:hypothetical protein
VPADLPIRCSCGALRGVVRGASGKSGNRVVCYCDDCQSFAHFLDRPGDVLDAFGGTEIFQTSAGRVELAAGADRLACVRLAPRGLARWYAACCRTPIGNTLATPRFPFVGLILGGGDSAARDEVLGPIRTRGHARFAKGAPPGAHQSFPARVFWIAIAARLRGDHRRSPFFDPATGAPTATPRVLGAAERAEVRARAGFG